jgi:hypothetical protein
MHGEVDLHSSNFGVFDLDDIFQHDLEESFKLSFPEDPLKLYNDLSENLLPLEISKAIPTSVACPLESQQHQFRVISPLPSIPKTVKEDIFRPAPPSSLPLEYTETNFIEEPTPEQFERVLPNCLFLRWYNTPPDRVHATSPSKLVGSSRPGTPFSFAAQLVAKCTDGKFIPFPASYDIVLVASVYGRRKLKTGATKNSDKKITLENLVKLHLNPIGKPLMVSESSENGVGARAILKQGETWVTFDDISLTCGSNAARSQNATPAARVWDWDYHIVVEALNPQIPITAVISKHITTDSNRSQTREKRKRESDASPTFAPFPPQKKRALAQPPVLSSFPLPRMKSYTKVFSAFKSDVYDFTSPLSQC